MTGKKVPGEGMGGTGSEGGPEGAGAGPGVPDPGGNRPGAEKGPAEMTGEQRIEALGASPFARLLGIEIVEARPGYARVVMDSTGKENFLGVAHGGAIFSLADQAFAAAANRGELLQVSVSVHIHYLSPAKGRLEAVARLIAETDTYSHILVEVKGGDRLVATFEGVAYKA